MRKSLALLTSASLLLAGFPLTVSAETDLPDLYVAGIERIACETETIENQENLEDQTVVYVADDQTYYDVREDTDVLHKERVYCLRVAIGNEGAADYAPASGEPSGRNQNFFITFSPYRNTFGDARSYTSWSFQEPIAAGATYEVEKFITVPYDEIEEDNFHIHVAVDELYNPLRHKYDEELTNLIDEDDETNNTLTEELHTGDIIRPNKPENLTIVEGDEDSFHIEWDSVDDIDEYRVYPYQDIALGTWLDTQFTTATEATIELVSDELHCVYVAAIKDEVSSGWPTSLCYEPILPEFSDTKMDSWYFGFLEKMQYEGIISGYKDTQGNLTGEYGPADTLTVAESLKIVMETVGVELSSSAEIPSQLSSHWGKEYFEEAAVLGMSLMINDSSLDPNRAVTREEIVQMFIEAAGLDVPEVIGYSLPDISGSDYGASIQFAYDLGIISGYPDGTFKPENNVNRAEITKIARNFMELL